MSASSPCKSLTPENKDIIIITGLSGAGKSTALRAFEDLNFFSVDGLPALLAPEIATLIERAGMENYAGIAMCMDMREPAFLQNFKSALAELAETGSKVSVVYLEASLAELLKRYASTRRPHPLEKLGISLIDAIERERAELGLLREQANLIIDSSGYSIHDLRRAIHRAFRREDNACKGPHINIVSFGFKYGLPQDSDYVFDLRFLPNPYFVEELKPLSGLDAAVAQFIFQCDGAPKLIGILISLFDFILPLMEKEGRCRITIAFGCTGGRHRSVAVAERFGRDLSSSGYSITLEHRNLNHDEWQKQCNSTSRRSISPISIT